MSQITKLREKSSFTTLTSFQRKEIAIICKVGVQYVHSTLHEYDKKYYRNKNKQYSIKQTLIIKVAKVFTDYNLNAIKAARKKAKELNDKFNQICSNSMS